MRNLLKNRKLQIIICILVTVIVISVLVLAFFHTEYTSIKTDTVITPPFEGTYFGMTVEEFCETMGITEDELIPAAPFDTGLYFDNQHMAELADYYKRPEKELRYYDQFENQYYFQYGKPIYGIENYYMDDHPMSIRLIFTNETTYQGKTIPPLLCAVYMHYPWDIDTMRAVENGIHIDRYGVSIDEFTDEMIKDLHHGNYKAYELDGRAEHKKAKLLSYLYASGMRPEEIEALDVPHMKEDDVSQLLNKIQKDIPIAIVPWQFNQNTGDRLDLQFAYTYAQAGYIIYYDWFLNELT